VELHAEFPTGITPIKEKIKVIRAKSLNVNVKLSP
jgi:hypothetical protein